MQTALLYVSKSNVLLLFSRDVASGLICERVSERRRGRSSAGAAEYFDCTDLSFLTQSAATEGTQTYNR